MIAISTTELRNNLRKYLDLAKVERIIIQCGKNETFELVPSERMSDGDRYMQHPGNAEAVSRGIHQMREGNVRKIKNPKDIWASLSDEV